ncbi:MAG: hypothetical protein ACI80L_001398 [Pseudohongiellaceae bacterium]|jgi:hypothetical protein
MTIAELGSLGEFFGFFAVLATLVYLAIQTQQSKKIAISEATRNVVSDFQILWNTLGDDPKKTRLIRIAVNDWEALSKNDQVIAHAFFINLIVHFTGALEMEDNLPELRGFIRAWEDNILGLVQCPGGHKWYVRCSYLFVPAVSKRIKDRLANVETLPPTWTDSLPWWRIDSTEIGSRTA